MTWIQTYTGRKFYPLDPHAEDVCIEDIAHALALKCRYTGHCREFFSIAQHSVMVSRMVPESDAICGLLHDATEAYLPDVARPIKDQIWGLTGILSERIEVHEKRLMKVIYVGLGIRQRLRDVTSADLCCLERERRQLLGPPPWEWSTAKYWDGDTTPIVCWDWREAEKKFLERWEELRLA